MLKRMKWLCGALLMFLLVLMFVPVMAATTWQPMGELTSGLTRALVIDPINSQTIYAVTVDKGVIKSTNGGTSWNAVNRGLTDISIAALAIDLSTTQTIYAAGALGGLFKSVDGGGSWSVSSNGLISTRVYSLAIDPTHSQTVYAGTEVGVFKSTNGGSSWNPANSGLFNAQISGLPHQSQPSVYVLAIDPNNSQTIYAGTSTDVFKSTNGGGAWSRIIGDGSDEHIYVRSLVIDPSNPQTIYIGTKWNSAFRAYGGVFKSTNGGDSWSYISTGLATTYVYSLVIDPINPQTVYAADYDGSGVFKSTNGGNSWSAVNSGLDNMKVASLAVDPTNCQTIYAGVFSGTSANSLYKGLSILDVPTISSTPDATATTSTVGTAYSFTPSSTDASSFSISGSVPPGMTFNTMTGTLSGTPTTAGSYNIVITVINASGSASLPAFTINVAPKPASVPVMEGWWLLPGMLAGVGIFARRRKE